MYTVIDEYHRGNLMEPAGVNTKYKTVDKKIKPVAVPLPEESEHTLAIRLRIFSLQEMGL
jgi:hypothetical protein